MQTQPTSNVSYTKSARNHLDAAEAFRSVLREERENPSAQAHTINALRDDATHAVRVAGVYANLAQATATRDLIAKLDALTVDLAAFGMNDGPVRLINGEVIR